MASDLQKLGPSELCGLLNSTPLGEVITEAQLRAQRVRAGLRIGDGRRVDLLRYVAWLLSLRHAPKPSMAAETMNGPDLTEIAQGAASLAARRKLKDGSDPALTAKQEAAIAALLSERTHAAAAAKADIAESTLYRWLNQPTFRRVYRQACGELIEAAVGRMKTAAGLSVDTLIAVARQGRRDSDRVRAAAVLLDYALRGDTEGRSFNKHQSAEPAAPLGTSGIVALLTAQLREIEGMELPTAEKSRLLAKLTDPLLRAINIDELEKRLAAVEAKVTGRPEDKDHGSQSSVENAVT